MDKLGWIVVSNNTKLNDRRGKHSRSSAEHLPWASAWYLRRSHGSVAPTGAVSGEQLAIGQTKSKPRTKIFNAEVAEAAEVRRGNPRFRFCTVGIDCN